MLYNIYLSMQYIAHMNDILHYKVRYSMLNHTLRHCSLNKNLKKL